SGDEDEFGQRHRAQRALRQPLPVEIDAVDQQSGSDHRARQWRTEVGEQLAPRYEQSPAHDGCSALRGSELSEPRSSGAVSGSSADSPASNAKKALSSSRSARVSSKIPKLSLTRA